MKDNQKLAAWFGFVFFGFLIGVFLSGSYGLYCNLTDSFKEGFFVVKKQFKYSELKTGVIVTVPVEWDNKYIAKGKKLIKRIGCNEGDYLANEGRDFFCNGVLIASALEKDSQGESIEQFSFSGYIPQGKMFLIADDAKSYDSRYYGLIEKTNVKEVGVWRF